MCALILGYFKKSVKRFEFQISDVGFQLAIFAI